MKLMEVFPAINHALVHAHVNEFKCICVLKLQPNLIAGSFPDQLRYCLYYSIANVPFLFIAGGSCGPEDPDSWSSIDLLAITLGTVLTLIVCIAMTSFVVSCAILKARRKSKSPGGCGCWYTGTLPR